MTTFTVINNRSDLVIVSSDSALEPGGNRPDS